MPSGLNDAAEIKFIRRQMIRDRTCLSKFYEFPSNQDFLTVLRSIDYFPATVLYAISATSSNPLFEWKRFLRAGNVIAYTSYVAIDADIL